MKKRHFALDRETGQVVRIRRTVVDLRELKRFGWRLLLVPLIILIALYWIKGTVGGRIPFFLQNLLHFGPMVLLSLSLSCVLFLIPATSAVLVKFLAFTASETFFRILSLISAGLGVKAWAAVLGVGEDPDMAMNMFLIQILLPLPDFKVVLWGGLAALMGWRSREHVYSSPWAELGMAGIVLGIAGILISATPVGDVLSLVGPSLAWSRALQ